ncbi:probable phospholipid-transporting ATPase VA [Trichonephila clavipes]|nr:probable phospholipid-transporting ATPase VA [Trichonephila clavipes]
MKMKINEYIAYSRTSGRVVAYRASTPPVHLHNPVLFPGWTRKEGRYVKTLWKNVHVGDLVHLSCNEVIPADILLLKCSDDQGLCYIETASLDGETNLKQRQTVRGLMAPIDSFHPSTFQGRIECDPPNHKIYHFNGCIIGLRYISVLLYVIGWIWHALAIESVVEVRFYGRYYRQISYCWIFSYGEDPKELVVETRVTSKTDLQ